MPTPISAPSLTAPSASILNVADIQGVVLRGYSHHLYIRFFILRIRDVPGAVAGAQKLCGLLAGDATAPLTVTTSQQWSVRPAYCLNLAVTSSGLKKLVGAANYASIGPPKTSGAVFNLFNAGAANANSAAGVGDTGDSDPSKWWQNGNWKIPSAPPSNADLDLLVALYTPDAASREPFAQKFLAMIPPATDGAPAVIPAFVQDSDPLLDDTGKTTEKIHFDYVDGISQPRVKNTPWYRPDDPNDQRPPVESWHFVVDPQNADYNAHPAFLDGCFGAFRLLYQDVAKFRCFVAQASDPALVMAKMCGRWQDGTPLMLSPDQPDPSIRGKALSNFGYAGDQTGAVCPFAAHTRRANPRDDTAVAGNTDNASPHRVMRRARPYGPPYEVNPAAQRGLVGLFLGANLTNQFQFVMQQWIGLPGFRSPDNSPNQSGVDPLFGPLFTSAATEQDFIYLENPPPAAPIVAPPNWQTVPSLSRFVRTDGALYVFIPSLKALRLFAQGEVIAPPSPFRSRSPHAQRE